MDGDDGYDTYTNNDRYKDRDSDSHSSSDNESSDARKSSSQGRVVNDDERTMFVKNISQEVTESKLRRVFPDSVKIRLPMRDDGYPKGFAYVVFETKDDVQRAIDDCQGKELCESKLYLDYEGKDSKTKPTKRKFSGSAGVSKSLYVRQLWHTVTSEKLKDAFENATNARIITYPDTGRSKGYGFVEFETPEDAEDAMDAMKGETIDGHKVYIDFATEEGSRNKGFRGGYNSGNGRGGGGYRDNYGDSWGDRRSYSSSRDGHSRDGYSRDNYSRDGYSRDGYSRDGYRSGGRDGYRSGGYGSRGGYGSGGGYNRRGSSGYSQGGRSSYRSRDY